MTDYYCIDDTCKNYNPEEAECSLEEVHLVKRLVDKFYSVEYLVVCKERDPIDPNENRG